MHGLRINQEVHRSGIADQEDSRTGALFRLREKPIVRPRDPIGLLRTGCTFASLVRPNAQKLRAPAEESMELG